DPLYQGDITVGDVVLTLGKVIFILVALIVSVMLMIWFERKVVADMQNRVGPNKAGPWGILQTLADGMKLIFKEDLIPDNADRKVFKLAPYLSVVPAFLTFAIVPFGGNFSDDKAGTVHIFDRDTYLQVADPPVGLLWFLAMSSIAVYGVMLAGWSSGSKYPLLGSVRATAQMVSYEAALGLSAAAVFLQSGSLSTHDIVSSQWHWDWNLWVTGFVPFVVFLIAGTAELNRPPFDLVEAEQELVGGFHTEYSAARFAMFYVAEFMNVITMSAIIITLFFGGPNGPLFGPDWLEALLPTVWFFLKLLVFLTLFVAIRNTLPRFRYDQLMDLGWKLLIPLALFWFVMLGALDVGEDRDWNPVVVPLVAAGALVVGSALLLGAARVARETRLREEVPY
ncbi:MAG TPA: NADH-quinone oxidoreductase subunit NuoH, partial [Acidimicrobiales bacterium]